MTSVEAQVDRLQGDAQVHRVLVGAFRTAVEPYADPQQCGVRGRCGERCIHSRRCQAPGVSCTAADGNWPRCFAQLPGVSVGMLAFDATLKVDEATCAETTAEHVVFERGAGWRVAIVGQQSFVEPCGGRGVSTGSRS